MYMNFSNQTTLYHTYATCRVGKELVFLYALDFYTSCYHQGIELIICQLHYLQYEMHQLLLAAPLQLFFVAELAAEQNNSHCNFDMRVEAHGLKWNFTENLILSVTFTTACTTLYMNLYLTIFWSV